MALRASSGSSLTSASTARARISAISACTSFSSSRASSASSGSDDSSRSDASLSRSLASASWSCRRATGSSWAISRPMLARRRESTAPPADASSVSQFVVAAFRLRKPVNHRPPPRSRRPAERSDKIVLARQYVVHGRDRHFQLIVVRLARGHLLEPHAGHRRPTRQRKPLVSGRQHDVFVTPHPRSAAAARCGTRRESPSGGRPSSANTMIEIATSVTMNEVPQRGCARLCRRTLPTLSASPASSVLIVLCSAP